MLRPAGSMDEPTSEWQRMAAYVQTRVRFHPELEPLREAGVSYSVQAEVGAIWITAMAYSQGEGKLLKEVIDRSEWWAPMKRTHADEIAGELAVRVRKSWQEAQPQQRRTNRAH